MERNEKKQKNKEREREREIPEGQTANGHGVAGELGQQVAVGQVPHQDALVGAARRQETAVDRERQRRHRPLFQNRKKNRFNVFSLFFFGIFNSV